MVRGRCGNEVHDDAETEDACNALVRASEDSMVERVDSSLFGSDGTLQSLSQVARGLGMGERTLKRRLAERGTSYSRLLDAQRRRRALELLGTTVTIEHIAEQLGYSDAASFTRAFRRWTGKSPSAFRRDH